MIEIWMKNHLVSDIFCNTINVGLTFSVDDTILRFAECMGARQLELVTLSTLFSIIRYFWIKIDILRQMLTPNGNPH